MRALGEQLRHLAREVRHRRIAGRGAAAAAPAVGATSGAAAGAAFATTNVTATAAATTIAAVNFGLSSRLGSGDGLGAHLLLLVGPPPFLHHVQP